MTSEIEVGCSSQLMNVCRATSVATESANKTSKDVAAADINKPSSHKFASFKQDEARKQHWNRKPELFNIADNIDEAPAKKFASVNAEQTRTRKRHMDRDADLSYSDDSPAVSSCAKKRNIHFRPNRIISSDSDSSDTEPTLPQTKVCARKSQSVREKWTGDQIDALRAAFSDFLYNDKLPLWADILEAQKLFPVLASRSKEKVKARFVHLKKTNR